MATEAPDPRTFKTWEDAFQYPIPVVAKLEQQLRSHAAENRDKLRSLVGASYRDLLTTASTIITMETQMDTVEANLAHISHNTNSRNLDRIARSTARAHAQARDRDADRFTFASQMAMLRACPGVIARLMKSSGDREGNSEGGKGGNYLLVAKVLVIARLLHKALSAPAQGKPPHPLVNQIRDKLGSLRSKLLRRIDKRLASAGDTDALVQSMCAYALATSSTPTDVLRHFHHVRMERILGSLRKETNPNQHGKGLKEHGIEALKLCLKTTQDTQAIFPRRLADALAKLKAHPMVQDPDVRACYELNLDIHERWIGDEARNYTPQPRHDELKRAEAERLLGVWGKQAVSAFLKEIKEALRDTRDLKEVAELRQELAETWIMQGSRMAGVKSRVVLDDLREAMNGQLEIIVRSRTQSLKSVVDLITGVLGSWQDDREALSLWNATSTSTDLSNGAQAFKQRILNTHQGRDDAVIRVVAKYDEWMDSVLEVKTIVKHMKETRWDDPFSDDIDLSDSDDEGGDTSKQAILSGDDPRLLEEVTQEALADALSALGKSFASISGGLTEANSDRTGDEGRVAKAIFLLRVVREISDRIPRLLIQDKTSPLASPFTKDILRPLHLALASHIVHPSIESYSQSLKRQTSNKSKTHNILWEGAPPLPAQPSPSAFRFLNTLVKSMALQGSDLWAPEGVRTLKELVGEEMERVWVECVRGVRDGGDGGDVHTPPSSPEEDAEKENAGAESSEKDKAASSHEEGGGDEDETEPQPQPEQGAEDKVEEVEEPPRTSADTDCTDERKSEQLKQLAFDILYLRRFLSTANGIPDSNTSSNAWEAVYEAATLDEGMKTRLEKSAGDYARKTYLLFALLA